MEIDYTTTTKKQEKYIMLKLEIGTCVSWGTASIMLCRLLIAETDSEF